VLMSCSACEPPHLMLYSENVVFVFDIVHNEWIQSLPLKRVSALLISAVSA